MIVFNFRLVFCLLSLLPSKPLATFSALCSSFNALCFFFKLCIGVGQTVQLPFHFLYGQVVFL